MAACKPRRPEKLLARGRGSTLALAFQAPVLREVSVCHLHAPSVAFCYDGLSRDTALHRLSQTRSESQAASWVQTITEQGTR